MAGNLLLFITIWLLQKYDRIQMDQVLFQIKSPASGANTDLLNSFVFRGVFLGAVAGTAEIFLYRFLAGYYKKHAQKSAKYREYTKGKFCRFVRKSAMPLTLCLLIVAVSLFVSKLELVQYIEVSNTQSDFIEENYVDPLKAHLTFPKQKRNLIYIFLESMENTYTQTAYGGEMKQDYIPELRNLAEKNINFSNTEKLGGARSFTGTTWTAAAMVAQTSGISVKVPLTAATYGGQNSFIPGTVSIGEVLEKEGYNQCLLLGSDAAFAGRDSYFTEHGHYDIVDINRLKQQGRLPEDYYVWWGYEDSKLFGFAKEELTRLSGEGKPFNFTMLTADTHFPDGYFCENCRSDYDSQYANVLACSSRQVAAFVEWIQQQPFYENTTVIICGDHLTMDPKFLSGSDVQYVRTTYNCIINSPVQPVREKNRQFGSFDFFPTTLAALGVQIEGDRLGLGTNLFSDRETFCEQYGFEELDLELQKKSRYYNTRFLRMTESQESKSDDSSR